MRKHERTNRTTEWGRTRSKGALRGVITEWVQLGYLTDARQVSRGDGCLGEKVIRDKTRKLYLPSEWSKPFSHRFLGPIRARLQASQIDLKFWRQLSERHRLAREASIISVSVTTIKSTLLKPCSVRSYIYTKGKWHHEEVQTFPGSLADDRNQMEINGLDLQAPTRKGKVVLCFVTLINLILCCLG